MYIIIDGSSMLSTNYYGTLPREMLFAKTEEEREKLYDKIMKAPDGRYTNGVFTSLKQILNLIKAYNPEGIVVVLDASRNTFRREIYHDYKAQRGSTPYPLKEQFDTFADVLKRIGINVYSSDTYEADDLAGAVVKKLELFEKECVLISADKDYYQLVSPSTSLWRIIPSLAKAKYEKIYGINFDSYTKQNNLPAGIFETKYGDGTLAEGIIVDLTPEQFVDYLAVVGDKSDNIPGVNKVGPMTIIPLLKEYRSLNAIYQAIYDAQENNQIAQLISKWKNELGIKTNPINAFLKEKENAEISQSLAQIRTDIDWIPNDISAYSLSINSDALKAVIDEYAFGTLNKFI